MNYKENPGFALGKLTAEETSKAFRLPFDEKVDFIVALILGARESGAVGGMLETKTLTEVLGPMTTNPETGAMVTCIIERLEVADIARGIT
jgi:hypothetical protein